MKTRMIVFGFIIMILACNACDVGGGKEFYTDSKRLDFGKVYLGESTELECVLYNHSESAISINDIKIVGSARFVANPSGSNSILILQRNETTIKVTYSPIAKTEDEAKLVVSTTFSVQPIEISLAGTGIGFSKMRATPELLEYKAVVKNQTLADTIDIENFGINDLEITKFTITGTDASLFSIVNGGTTPLNIAPGSIHTINVMFSPTSGGNFSANLEIEHNAVNLSSPLIIQLSGESLNYEPKIAVNRTSPWDFGTVSTCFTIEDTIAIQNIGVDPLYIRDVKVSNATEFSVKRIYSSSGEYSYLPATLNPGKELFIVVEFTPLANIQYNDKLIIEHNAMNANNPIVLDLVGVGKSVTTKAFQFTGSPQQFVVPAGVTRLKLELWGAEGGLPYPTYPQTTAGKGGYVVGFINVTPGETFEIYVGGKGQDATLGVAGLGGWNGGGCGDSAPGPQYYGPGGGGASDIRFGGNTLYDRIIVAGAGGGAAAYMADCDGGDGGGLEGEKGILTGTFTIMFCGEGGCQNRGGIGAERPFTTYWGVFGIGGDAKDIGHIEYGSGPGGGAGWYGGGAGNMGGAGGGSSYTDPQKIFDFQHQQGIRTGNGLITISY